MTDIKNVLYIGWDTGAWMTKKNDGLCLLAGGAPEKPHSIHGGLSKDIIDSQDFDEFLGRVLHLVGVPIEPTRSHPVTLAIDAPFAFPAAVRNLLDGNVAHEVGEDALANPYLFRRTERYVRQLLSKNPLSAIQDRIGSQTTKVMHFLAKFGFRNNGNGIWSLNTKTGGAVCAIETYPALCKVKDSEHLRPAWLENECATLQECRRSNNSDEKDALVCAMIAKAFVETPQELHAPPGIADDSFDPKEGWIWHPLFEPEPMAAGSTDGIMQELLAGRTRLV